MMSHEQNSRHREAAKPDPVRPHRARAALDVARRQAFRRTGMSWFPFDFEAPIERFSVGKVRKIWYKVLFLPDRFVVEPPFDRLKTVRVDGEIAEVPVTGAWMPTGDGRRWFIVAPHVFKTAEVRLGDTVEMRFRIDDQNRVDVPAELARALTFDQAAREAWEALTPGKRRAHAHRVASAKSSATVGKRVAEVLTALNNNLSVSKPKAP